VEQFTLNRHFKLSTMQGYISKARKSIPLAAARLVDEATLRGVETLTGRRLMIAEGKKQIHSQKTTDRVIRQRASFCCICN